MKNSKKTLKMLVICIMVTAVVAVISQFRVTNSYEDYQHIKIEDIFNNPDDESYYLYFYEVDNDDCEEVQDQVKEYARSHSTMYFVNLTENEDSFKEFNWHTFHEENDIEIGTVENNKIKYYEGESKTKYSSKQYKIIKANKTYLKTNKKAKKGYAYASLQVPNIDYSNINSAKDIPIAKVPTLLHIENEKIDKAYYGAKAIDSLMDKLNEE